jgi:predicted dinucleotide-binding enzyme
VASLSEDINEVVIAHVKRALENGETINVPGWVSEVAASLADMILHAAPTDEQPALIGHAHQQLDEHIALKRADGVGVDKH